MQVFYAVVLIICVTTMPHVRSQCTKCKPGIEYCDNHQADGMGRCESCMKLCFPGQNNEKICQFRCPDFHNSVTAGYVEPGKATLELSRSNAQAVSTLNGSLAAMARKAVQEPSSSSHTHISLPSWALALSIVAPSVLLVLAALLALFLWRRRRNRQKSGNDEEAEQHKPFTAELEQTENHHGERYTGRESPGHPTGEVSDLHPDQKETIQPLSGNDQPANVVAPSGRPYNR